MKAKVALTLAVAVFGAAFIGSAKGQIREYAERGNSQQEQKIEFLSDYWGVDRETLRKLDPELLTAEQISSVGGFNPYSVEIDPSSAETVDEMASIADLTTDEIYKFLRYRREEVGICFEDEEMDDKGQCVVVAE